MGLPAIVELKFNWSMWLTVYLSSTGFINCQLLAENQIIPSLNSTDASGNNETNNSSSSNEISLPKAQRRIFRWLMNGLSDQSNGGSTSNPDNNLLLNRQGYVGGSYSGYLPGFRRPMRPPMGESFGSFASQSMIPPMGSSIGQSMMPPMGPSMGQSTGQSMRPPMAPPMGSPMGQSQPMGWSQMGQNSGLPPNSQYLGMQGGQGFNSMPNGQFNSPMNYPTDNLSTDDPNGDYGGGDFFTQLNSFLFGSSNDYESSVGSCGGGRRGERDRGKINTNIQSVQTSIGTTTTTPTSSMGMSSEDWSNYIKLVTALAGDGGGGGGGSGGGGGGGGLGDLSSLMDSASSMMQSFG